ncbi:MAG: class I SAM-dependent methyltransferase [Burkholderiaceae bacterium]|nr:class I SAM-dependent methyltransferase [Burkholderiaceae bacterium]
MNLASRYNAIPGISLGTKLFLHLRWLLTPYSDMSNYVPTVGRVLDVGCGHGLLAMKMALSAPGREVLATDHDEQRIEVARLAGAGIDNLQFEVSTGSPVQGGNGPEAVGTFDAIMMIDFLHYFSPEEQDSMIRQAFAKLTPGGWLLAREVDQHTGLLSKINQLYEKLATWTAFTQTKAVDTMTFRSQPEWEAKFAEHGFKVHAKRCSSPIFEDILFICEKG